MVSVALLTRKRGGPIPRTEWTRRQLQLAKRAAMATIDGVGEPDTDAVEDGEITFIVRRQCNDSERRLVLEKYLSS